MWIYGLGYVARTGAKSLAARFLDQPNLILTDGADPVVYPNGTMYLLPGGAFPDTYQVIPLPGATGHFPYHVAVEPDVHT